MDFGLLRPLYGGAMHYSLIRLVTDNICTIASTDMYAYV